MGLQDAQILHIRSPSDFSVRMCAFDREFYLLKERLNAFYSRHSANLKLGPELARSLKPRDTVAVVHESCWSRGLVLSTDQYQVTVWLIDYGTTHESTVGAVYNLVDEFLKERAFSIKCHLPQEASSPWPAAATVEMETLVENYGPYVQIERYLPTDTLVFRGASDDETPDYYGYDKSLAVNLTWSFEEAISPVEPLIKKTISLLAKLESLQFSDKSSEEDMNLSEEIDQLADSLTEAINLSPLSDDETDFKNSLSSGSHNEPTNSNFRWPKPQIPSDDEFLARCTHVDHAGQFYLQMENSKFTIKSMHDELSSKHSGPKKSSIRVKEGSECIARYVDGRFYRGRVLNYGPFEGRSTLSDEAQVLFVDFGHPSIVKIKNIRSNLSFKSLPIQAVRVVLHDVRPRNGGLWPDNCLDFMYQKTNCASNVNRSPVRVTVMGDNLTMPLQVKISVSSKNGIWVDLSDLLVEAGEANYDDSFVKTFEVQKHCEKESHGIGYVSPLSSRPNDNFTPEKIIEVNHPLDFPFRKLLDPLRFIKAGDIVRVKLASVMSCNRIYVHPVVEHSDNSGANSRRVHSELKMLGIQYEDMMKRLQEDAPRMPPVINPSRGLPVAAKFQVEGSLQKLWYRGNIHEIVDGKVKVIFVDFDLTAWNVESTELVELPSFCGDVPVIRMEMKLGVVAADDEEVAGVVMGECLWGHEGGILTAKIISKNPRQVHIIDPATRKPVYSSLMEDGFISNNID